ncbi:OmpA family protein [Turneriella parva]|uniref:OmpA/MotB domain protein n=1 Tax=Turneriella parva (strain ATCC BAA-1111 / DSM 21527 / NCTC 11395 / H) TaxID=869212 RepID=I4B4N2_TURPD|nr:OmpA family protein [Turneriella parva]AFM12239.1 OmpA/MotB domain protein [Turneriella parva DSM 21527]
MLGRLYLLAAWLIALVMGCTSIQTRQADAEFRSLVNRLQYLHNNAIEDQVMYDSVSARLKLVLDDSAVVSNYENQLLAANYVRQLMSSRCSAEVVQPETQQKGLYRYAIRMYCPNLSSPALLTLQAEGLQFFSGDAIIVTKITPIGELWFRGDFVVREFESPKPQVVIAARYRAAESLAVLKQAFGLRHNSTIRMAPGNLAIPPRGGATKRAATEAGTWEVFFAQSSSALSAQMKASLDSIKIPSGSRVQVIGHAAKTERAADDLSRDRALAILQYLKSRYPQARYRYRSFGSRKPGYPHNSPDAAKLNRRVVVRLVQK